MIECYILNWLLSKEKEIEDKIKDRELRDFLFKRRKKNPIKMDKNIECGGREIYLFDQN